jgi:Mn2+/Fe2+ NRAMP family transporter
MVVDIPWREMARGLFIPTLSASTTFWTSVVAILGTTISPYLFFWQASQEVEEVEATSKRDPLKYAPHQAGSALARIRLDTYIGMAFSNLVASDDSQIGRSSPSSHYESRNCRQRHASRKEKLESIH